MHVHSSVGWLIHPLGQPPANLGAKVFRECCWEWGNSIFQKKDNNQNPSIKNNAVKCKKKFKRT